MCCGRRRAAGAGAWLAPLLLASLASPGSTASPSYCTKDVLQQYSTGWPAQLDWGIYWFGPGDKSEKAVPGQKSQYYDPKKKTLIYFHGWTGKDGGTTASCKRVTTACPGGQTGCPAAGDHPLAENWLADGWNVGFFYWDQFADEDCTRDAEQKVWFDRDGDGLRWKSFDPQTGSEKHEHYKEEASTVADLCVQAVEQNLGDFAGGAVRFVGHSIGAQLAARCAGKLHMWTPRDLPSKLLSGKVGHPAAPQRLALLEPYFTKHHFGLFRCHKVETGSGIGKFTAMALPGYVGNLREKYGVVTEVYKSSAYTEDMNQLFPEGLMNQINQVGSVKEIVTQLGEANHELEKVATVVQYQPDWCDSKSTINSKFSTIANHLPGVFEKVSEFDDLECRHAAVLPLYLAGYGLPPPRLTSQAATAIDGQPGSAIEGCATPSATCTDGQIKEWVDRQKSVKGIQRWTQSGGKSTFECIDDTFSITPELNEKNDEVVILAATERPPQASQEPWWHLQGAVSKVAAFGAMGLLALAVLGISVRLGAGLYRHACSGDGSDSDDWKDLEDEHGDEDDLD